MTQKVNPEKIFKAFEMYGHVKPIAGTYNLVELKLEDSSFLLENQNQIKFFHDPQWLKKMSSTMLFCMSQKPLPVMSFAGAMNILLLYQSGLNFSEDPTTLLSSSAASFLGTQLQSFVKLKGKLFEFPNMKIMTAYFLWKQKLNRQLILESLLVEALLKNTPTDQIQDKLSILQEEESKIEVIKELFKINDLSNFHINGILSYWSLNNDSYLLSMHDNLPIGTDFLTLMMDLIGNTEE